MQLPTGLVFQSKNINDIENQLNEHCLKSVRICSFSGPYFPVFSPNTDTSRSLRFYKHISVGNKRSVHFGEDKT